MKPDMKPDFEANAQTRDLVSFYCSMAMSQEVSYPAISSSVGFEVTPANSASARYIADRDYDVFIGIIRGVGFFRGTHSDAARSLPRGDSKIRKAAKRQGRRAEFALKGKLTNSEREEASEYHRRARTIYATTGEITVFSNRKVREEPPVHANQPAIYDALSKFRKK